MQFYFFLFKSRKGYCSFFAFAMALLCRSLGIPARVAVGFYIDPFTETLNFYPVRADMAHAWVEIFFNEYGWIEPDTTSEVIAPGEDYTFREVDFARFTSLIEEILSNQDKLKPDTTPQIEKEQEKPEWASRLVSGLWVLIRYWYIVIVVLYISITATVYLSPFILFVMVKDRRRKVKLLFKGEFKLLTALGWEKNTAESTMEYARRLDREEGIHLESFAAYYLKAVFSPDYNTSDFKKLSHL